MNISTKNDKKPRRVTIQEDGPRTSLQRSLTFLNELITEVEQMPPPEYDHNSIEQDTISLSHTAIEPPNLRSLPSQFSHDSLSSRSLLPTPQPGFQGTSTKSPRQTDHWMYETKNRRIKEWLKNKDEQTRKNIRQHKIGNREKIQESLARERERKDREQEAKTAYIDWLTKKYKLNMLEKRQSVKN